MIENQLIEFEPTPMFLKVMELKMDKIQMG